MHIVVLGDIHGHLHLAWSLVKRIEVFHGIEIAQVLQVGDLGFWPRPGTVLDRATRRHADQDPEEISFPEWSSPTELDGGSLLSSCANALLSPEAPDGTRVDADMVFIKGNHDDYALLPDPSPDGLPIPVDHYGKHRFLPNGCTYRVGGAGGPLVGSLGGLERGEARTDGFSDTEAKGVSREQLDILLTHEPPGRTARGSRLRRVLEASSPAIVFSGHLHWHERDTLGEVQLVTLAEVRFNDRGEVDPGCAGILAWAPAQTPRFEVLHTDFTEAFPGRSMLIYPGDDAQISTPNGP